MKTLLFLLLVMPTSKADVWTGTISSSQEYACLGIDGVPIGNSSPMAATCCNSDHYLIENAPATCHAGFQTITTDAGTGAVIGVNLANSSLTTASEIGSDSLDTSGTHPNLGGSPGVRGESSASIAGGTGGSFPSGMTSAASGQRPSAIASNVGGSGAASGGSGLSVGSSSNEVGNKGDAHDPNFQKANGGGYVKGSDGKLVNNGNGGFFGNSGAGAAGGVGSDAKVTDLQLGEGREGLAGANGAGEDPDGRGSAEDPSDYFNRIDKSADIFKVVSARYLKKKSLWVVPEKKI